MDATRRDGEGRPRYRRLIWVPRGPAGLALFIVAVALIVALLLVLSVVVLALAVTGAIGYALYGAMRRSLRGDVRGRQGRALAGRRRSRAIAVDRPLERYLADIEEYDSLTTRVLRLDLDTIDSWRTRRRLAGVADRVAALRESAIAVERTVSRDLSAEAARSGLWELIVGVTELQRFVYDLADFPTSRGRTAQSRELQLLEERRDDLARRRDELVRRLQRTDLRGELPVNEPREASSE